MAWGFRIDGATEFDGALDALQVSAFWAARQAVADGVDLIGESIRHHANTGSHPPHEGHIPGTGPGPNTATGNLLASVQHDPSPEPYGTSGWESHVGVTNEAPYAVILDGGHGSETNPRQQRSVGGARAVIRRGVGEEGRFPFFLAAVEESLPGVQEIFNVAMKAALGG